MFNFDKFSFDPNYRRRKIKKSRGPRPHEENWRFSEEAKVQTRLFGLPKVGDTTGNDNPNFKLKFDDRCKYIIILYSELFDFFLVFLSVFTRCF